MVMPGLQGLIGMFTDSSLKVRESLTWVIGKICEHHADILINNNEFTGLFVNQLCNSLQDKPKISQQVCQAIDRLSESVADLNNQDLCESNALTPYF